LPFLHIEGVLCHPWVIRRGDKWQGKRKEVGLILVNKALSGDIDTRIPMETIHLEWTRVEA
jgi:hypothetical protein